MGGADIGRHGAWKCRDGVFAVLNKKYGMWEDLRDMGICWREFRGIYGIFTGFAGGEEGR